MTIGKSLIPEFEMEMVGTRKVLERIPDDKLGWKIHDKSNTIGWVANHLSDIPGWVEMTLNHDNLDLDPPGGEPFKSPDATSTAAILELFDKNVAEGRKLLDSVPDETLFQPWALLKAGEKLLEMPKIAVLRTWVLNHTIHHRAHLCVYLRVNDIPVPGLYGPSGDETTM